MGTPLLPRAAHPNARNTPGEAQVSSPGEPRVAELLRAAHGLVLVHPHVVQCYIVSLKAFNYSLGKEIIRKTAKAKSSRENKHWDLCLLTDSLC